jgi:hypothetical protein
MLTYADITWCSSSSTCQTPNCHRRFTEEDHQKAVKWWGGDDYLLSVSPFKDTTQCPGFIAKEIK